MEGKRLFVADAIKEKIYETTREAKILEETMGGTTKRLEKSTVALRSEIKLTEGSVNELDAEVKFKKARLRRLREDVNALKNDFLAIGNQLHCIW